MSTPDAQRARARFDEWMRVLRIVQQARPGFDPGPVISEHMTELYHASLDNTVSSSGSEPTGIATLETVRSEWRAPRDAGAAVGMSGRRVLQLVDAGAVDAWEIDRRTKLVSFSSLRRHLRRGAA